MLDRPEPAIRPFAPPARSVILRPGMRTLPPGVERFRIEGGQKRTVKLEAGDRITLTDVEGGQVCELTALGEDGKADPGIIGAPGAAPVHLFGETSAPGAAQEFRVERDGVLIVSAPGDAMQPGAQDTATPIELRIHRANPRAMKDRIVLPDPLADPLQDIRVNRSTAEAYVVKAGEYIQIIDVAGRQCSDFQCFSARKLDSGKERPSILWGQGSELKP